ncbi:MAG: hypothetical protein F6K16_17340 [Symploca sp. SIO2B6]|nr:hypothetical protein [Symploca sp. SIO2B6]
MVYLTHINFDQQAIALEPGVRKFLIGFGADASQPMFSRQTTQCGLRVGLALCPHSTLSGVDGACAPELVNITT